MAPKTKRDKIMEGYTEMSRHLLKEVRELQGSVEWVKKNVRWYKAAFCSIYTRPFIFLISVTVVLSKEPSDPNGGINGFLVWGLVALSIFVAVDCFLVRPKKYRKDIRLQKQRLRWYLKSIQEYKETIQFCHRARDELPKVLPTCPKCGAEHAPVMICEGCENCFNCCPCTTETAMKVKGWLDGP